MNDLFALVADKPEWFSNDGVHLNAKGSTAMGEQVAPRCSRCSARGEVIRPAAAPTLASVRHTSATPS